MPLLKGGGVGDKYSLRRNLTVMFSTSGLLDNYLERGALASRLLTLQ